MNRKVLVVDDSQIISAMLKAVLEANNCPDVTCCEDGSKALDYLKKNSIDLILLDVEMPVMDGFQVIKKLKSDPVLKKIPVIFLTAKSEVADHRKGFELGAVDYISKPFDSHVVVARVNTHLQLKHASDELAQQNVLLEQRVQERTQEILNTQEIAIQALANLAETRDNETGLHIRRTQLYVEVLSGEMASWDKYKSHLTEEVRDQLSKSAPLHDIGKVGIPDNVLLKKGKLSEEEYELMKKHAFMGASAIRKAVDAVGSCSFLSFAEEIAISHHEKWDGTGYPNKIKGEDIPLSGRIMAVADVYDALTSKRCYKDAFSHAKAKAIIAESSGTHFDPDVVAAFLEQEEKIRAIAEKYSD